VALFLRTTTCLFLVLAFLSTASVAAADTLAQAATATPTPPPQTGPTATAIPCVTTKPGVQIVLANPQPYDTLITGTQVVMNGIAYDTTATSGTGISQVSLYLGSRESGGTALGNATTGQPNPQVPAGSQFANAGFTLRTPTLPSGSGGRSIFVYARSSVSSQEGVLEVPVYLNTSPTPVKNQIPTPVLPTPAPCTPTPTATATSAPTSTPVVAPTTPPSPTAPAVPATPTLLTVATPPPTVAPPVAPAPPAASPVAVSTPVPATAQTVAPRGGGIPAELGLIVLAAGSAIVGGAMALRRRGR
jgi:hypothetical protein